MSSKVHNKNKKENEMNPENMRFGGGEGRVGDNSEKVRNENLQRLADYYGLSMREAYKFVQNGEELSDEKFDERLTGLVERVPEESPKEELPVWVKAGQESQAKFEKEAAERRDVVVARLRGMKPTEMAKYVSPQELGAVLRGEASNDVVQRVYDSLNGGSEQVRNKPETQEKKRGMFGKMGKRAIAVALAGMLLAGGLGLHFGKKNTEAKNVPTVTEDVGNTIGDKSEQELSFEDLDWEGTDYRGKFLDAEGDAYNPDKAIGGETSWNGWAYDISPRVLDGYKAENDTRGAMLEVLRQVVKEPEFLAIFASRLNDEDRANMGLGGLKNVVDIENKFDGDVDALDRAEKSLLYMMENKGQGRFEKFTGRATNYYMRAVNEGNIENVSHGIEAARTATRNYDNVDVFAIRLGDGSEVMLDIDCLNVIVRVAEGTPEAEVEPGVPILVEEKTTPEVTPKLTPDLEVQINETTPEEEQEMPKIEINVNEKEPELTPAPTPTPPEVTPKPTPDPEPSPEPEERLEGKDESLTNEDVKDNNKPLEQDGELTENPNDNEYKSPKSEGSQVEVGEGGGLGTAVDSESGEGMRDGDRVETPNLGEQEREPVFHEETNEDRVNDATVVSEGDGQPAVEERGEEDNVGNQNQEENQSQDFNQSDTNDQDLGNIFSDMTGGGQ